MARWRRITGAAGLIAGATAVGAGAVITAERIAVRRLREHGDAGHAEPFGTLRGEEVPVVADDGVSLHVETNGPASAAVTVVFCHGYTVNSGTWHYQRRDITGCRMVFWDQRDHGRSGRSAAGAASIDQLGSDLKAVIDAAAPGEGPLVLVGHSMGGMTIMALAEQHPELFGTRVAGVVLISSTAAGLARGSPWMPAPVRPVLTRVLPGVLNGAATGRRAMLVDRGRAVSSDLAFLSTRFIGFGEGDVDPAAVAFLEQMVRETPIEVVARFFQCLMACDKRASLPVLGRVPVTVIVGERDRMVAPQLGIDLAMGIPGSRLLWVPGGGHALLLERPALVTEAIEDMVAQVSVGHDFPQSA